jgi:hypothetical protein
VHIKAQVKWKAILLLSSLLYSAHEIPLHEGCVLRVNLMSFLRLPRMSSLSFDIDIIL